MADLTNTGIVAPDPTQTQSPADEIETRIAQAVASALTQAERKWNERLNAAITNRIKATKTTEQTPAPHDATEGDATQPTSQVAMLQREVARMRAQVEESQRAATSERVARQTDAANVRVAQALAAKGITGARARAVLADMRQSNALRLDDDGNVILTVRTPIAKGAKPEPVDYADVSEAVDAWSKTDDAREFLPAPAIATTRNAMNQRPNGAPASADTPEAAERRAAEAKVHDWLGIKTD